MKKPSVGEKILEQRRKTGLSQEELGYEVGVSRQTVSKWENDQARPDSKSVKSLCRVFGVDRSYFACKEEPDSDDAAAEAESTSVVADMPAEVAVANVPLAVSTDVQSATPQFVAANSQSAVSPTAVTTKVIYVERQLVTPEEQRRKQKIKFIVAIVAMAVVILFQAFATYVLDQLSKPPSIPGDDYVVVGGVDRFYFGLSIVALVISVIIEATLVVVFIRKFKGAKKHEKDQH